MRLYIVRHAIAVPHNTPGYEEVERPLTEEGIEKMHQSAAGLRRLGYVPGLILSSPLPRARQTAEILSKVLDRKGIEIKIHSALAPGGSRRELYRAMDSHAKKLTDLMLVGHRPSLGEIAGEIAWGSPDCCIELKKGGACVIELERTGDFPRGCLVALLPPSLLRKISD